MVESRDGTAVWDMRRRSEEVKHKSDEKEAHTIYTQKNLEEEFVKKAEHLFKRTVLKSSKVSSYILQHPDIRTDKNGLYFAPWQTMY